MARIAIIKLFTGLNLAPAQLSGELLRAGHDSRIIYFKDYYIADVEEAADHLYTDYAGVSNGPDGHKLIWNCYQPFSATEYQLLIEELAAFGAEALAFSVISSTLKEAAQVTQELRKHLDIPIMWGGPGPTLEPEKCIEYADLLCINEGEDVIVELADRLDRGEDWSGIEGTWYRKDGEITRHGNRPLLDLNKIAFPDWDVSHYCYINDDKVKHDAYPHNLGAEYPIMTQRGCPFSCSFCIESRYQDMFGKKDSLRRRDVELVLDELKHAKAYLNMKAVLFYDDVFTVNPRWLKEFLPRYKEEIGLPFWCYTYPTTHNPKLLEMLKDAGMISITMGIQSGSTRILKEHFNRPTEKARILEAAREIVDLGPGVTPFFDLITNVEFERETDLRETFEFLQELPKEFKSVGLGDMTNFPTYTYTRDSDENNAIIGSSEELTPAIRDYYNKLYYLARCDLPPEQIVEIGNDPYYRENPEKIVEFTRDITLPITFTGYSFQKLAVNVDNALDQTA